MVDAIDEYAVGQLKEYGGKIYEIHLGRTGIELSLEIGGYGYSHLNVCFYRTGRERIGPKLFDEMPEGIFLSLVDILGSSKRFATLWVFLIEIRESRCLEINPKILWVVFKDYSRANLPKDAMRTKTVTIDRPNLIYIYLCS
ncbi:hypothetical protein I3843_08G155700 [Carya illinoinensis]|nr:hypothetical protein I3843_08G155700 [Carya illinoinensis]